MRKKKNRVASAIKVLGLTVLVLLFTSPYLWMIASALRSREDIFRYVYPLSWKTFIPLSPTLDNFHRLISTTPFLRALINSSVIAIVTVFLTLFIASMIAFVFARLHFPGRELLFVMFLSTMLVPFETIMVSSFLVIQRLNLYDTYTAIYLPWITDAFIIFLLRQHFKELPSELQDAAVVDGCSYFRVYWNIMLPNITPALVSAAFIKFVWSWDAFLWPLIVVTDPNKMVVSVAISKLFTDQNVRWDLIFTGSFLATVPLIILFAFLQRYYVQGIISSAIKG